MLEIPGYQIFRLGCLGTFQKYIVVGIGTRLNWLFRPNPQACFADGFERASDDLWASLKSGTADDLFVLSIDASSNAKLNRAIQGQEQ